jgi:hypothetical protein
VVATEEIFGPVQGAPVLIVPGGRPPPRRDDLGVASSPRGHRARLAVCAYTWDLTTRGSS